MSSLTQIFEKRNSNNNNNKAKKKTLLEVFAVDVDQIYLRSICKGFFGTQKSAEAT
jgi:hypothetical protein